MNSMLERPPSAAAFRAVVTASSDRSMPVKQLLGYNAARRFMIRPAPQPTSSTSIPSDSRSARAGTSGTIWDSSEDNTD